MTFTADQYSQIAKGYENAAADPLVAAEKRVDLAKKADWFRFLARRERARQSRNEQGTAPTSLDVEPKSRGRSWRSMAPFLTTLWITGAAVYLVSTVLFTNAVNLFGPEEPGTPVAEITLQLKPDPQVANSQVNNRAEQVNGQMATPESRHAIAPDQPAYESPTLITPSSPLPQEELASVPSEPDRALPSPPSEPGQDLVEVQPAEMLTVTSRATIRDGPSKAAKKIGTASAGAELQVKAREKDWVQFVDPSSGNGGWIESSLLAPVSGIGADGLIVPKAADTPPVKPAKPKLAKKKPSVPSQVLPRPRTYADLPADEEFVPYRRHGPGLLSRRRMFREGLMSPGFLPPD